MPVPILKQGEYLSASIQSTLSDVELVQLQRELVERVKRLRSRGVIVDVTVMDVVDSFACRTLRTIADMLNLCGAETVIVGTAPEVACAMVQMGLTLRDDGSGIPNIELGLQDGYSTTRSLGLGLPGAKRLTDEFEIVSEVGKGTTVRMKKWTSPDG